MSAPRRVLGLLAGACAAGASGGPAAGQHIAVWTDQPGDAALRRTDSGNNGAIGALCVMPDLTGATLGGWLPTDPVGDPYTGVVIPASEAHLFRLELTFAGLVNPPGTLGLGGYSFDPFRFGPSPVYGFIELDVDADIDTGGELGGAARLRYLANIARFGRLPPGPTASRAARTALDHDASFDTGPQFERSGADFSLVFCGCGSGTLVSESGNSNGVLEPGESMIVRGRFFERAQGYTEASAAFGGSDFGHYDPFVQVRFQHSQSADATTVTLVFALDMAGAAMLAGQPEQAIDLDVTNHTSVVEALQDIIDGATGLNGPVEVLTERWAGRDPYDFLDPTRWTLTALVGTSYAATEDTLYAWSDTGFADVRGDVNGDGLAGIADESLLIAAVYTLDTLPGYDANTTVRDGKVTVPNAGHNFNVYDIDGNMVVERLDAKAFGPLGDFNNDGFVNALDFLAFLNEFNTIGSLGADFDLNGTVNTLDFVEFLNAFGEGG